VTANHYVTEAYLQVDTRRTGAKSGQHHRRSGARLTCADDFL